MLEEAEPRKKSGAVTVLALLVSLLLGYAPAAQAEVDGRSSRLSRPELIKSAPLLRSPARGQEDPDIGPACPAVPPSIIVERRERAGSVSVAQAGLWAPFPAAHSYRARAPPAA